MTYAVEDLMSGHPTSSAVVNEYRPYSVLPRHVHRCASLSLVVRGRQVERIGRRSWECEPLSLLYKPPDVEHSNHVSASGLRALFIEIDPKESAAFIAEWPTLADIRCVPASSVSPAVRQLSRHLDKGVGPSPALQDGLLHELLGSLVGHGSRRPARGREPWLLQVLDFVHAHFDRRLTLPEAAAVGGVHPIHLAQTFRQALGHTFGQYVRALRLDAARAALADRSKSISAISIAAGFADHAHFSRTFRARFGVTPTDYRRSLP